jgi:hypothetical protein
MNVSHTGTKIVLALGFAIALPVSAEIGGIGGGMGMMMDATQ